MMLVKENVVVYNRCLLELLGKVQLLLVSVLKEKTLFLINKSFLDRLGLSTHVDELYSH